MDITVYLPDDVGKRAKEAEIPFSALLRAAVLTELERIEAMKTATDGLEEIKIELIDDNGAAHDGRFTGKQLADGKKYDAYLTDDERLIIHDPMEGKYWEYDATDEDAVTEAVDDLDDDDRATVMSTLGFRYVVDI